MPRQQDEGLAGRDRRRVEALAGVLEKRLAEFDAASRRRGLADDDYEVEYAGKRLAEALAELVLARDEIGAARRQKKK